MSKTAPPREAIPVTQTLNSGGVVTSPGTRETAVLPTAALPAAKPPHPGPPRRRRWGPHDWLDFTAAVFLTLLDLGLLTLYVILAVHYLQTRHG
jgi:hypothetical protein